MLCIVAPLTLANGAAPGGARHRARTWVNGRRAAEGELLVRFRAGVHPAVDSDVDVDEPVGQHGWRRIRSRSRTLAAFGQAMYARADVEAVEPNYEVSATATPNDLGGALWGLQNTGQMLINGEHGNAGADINAVPAWDVTTGSRETVVGIVDTGVMAGHPDLAANIWAAPHSFTVTIGSSTVTCPAGSHGFNAIVRSCDPSDDNGHGTHVAGSIGATGDNGTGVVGVNWTSSIMALKFLDASGNGFVSDAVDAIDFAIQARAAVGANIRVLNASWNGGDFSQALSDEIGRANDADMLFVASAGNTGADHGAQPSYPASYGAANLIAVASTNYRDELASYSDYGAETVHVAAPGSLIYSTSIGPGTPPTSGYATLSGTSMSAAYVSGTAALVLAHCSYSTGALRAALLSSAQTLPSLMGRVQSGRRIDASAAVRSCSNPGPSEDVVLWAADVPGSGRHGSWSRVADGTAAGGAMLTTADSGWSATGEPLASPVDYVDLTFDAPAGVPYRVWVRMRAAGNSKWNDSVWLQFSDARAGAGQVYAINSSAGLALNLENCSGCGVSGWGWQDGAYWVPPAPALTFASSGAHTIRVQTREDGVQFDQIVLAAAWHTSPPGQRSNDATIVPKSAGATSGPPASGPYAGVRATLPGFLHPERFDEGGEGSAYHDTTLGNSGAAFRPTDVDVQSSSDGGYNVGWVSTGEWLQYSVEVATSGPYLVQFRVAAPSAGGSFHLEAGGLNVSGTLTVPNTGDWQAWQTVSTTVTLPAGQQRLRIVFDTASSGTIGNFATITFNSGAQPPTATVLPGHVDAADFDPGPEGISFHDTTVGNLGGAYRTTNVDIEPCTEGGYNVGWIAAGEWLNYTANVSAPGQYVVRLRMSSPVGGSLHIGFNGASQVWTVVNVPATGGWQNWITVTVPATVAAGQQQLTLLFDTGGYNISRIEVGTP
jgi:thermitase